MEIGAKYIIFIPLNIKIKVIILKIFEIELSITMIT